MKLSTTNKLVSIFIQLLLLGPMNVVAPFAVIFGPVFMFTLLSKERFEGVDIAFSFGWIGLIGLYYSVFASPEKLHNRTKTKIAMSASIIFGIILTGITIADYNDNNSYKTSPDFTADFFAIWYFGGPAAVAVVNLYRIHVYSVLKSITAPG